ncbi:hypothetical protein BTVI_20596 [Pitangus sulphuratus]|nr:hypothetical protein BTVI_20596 [Pitangus sulphuratus]
MLMDTKSDANYDILNANIINLGGKANSFKKNPVRPEENKVLPTVSKGQVHDHLKNLKIHKSMQPDKMHLRVLRKLADVVAWPLFRIFEKSQQSSEVPGNWKRGNFIPIFKKGRRKDSGNYQFVGITSVSGKITEWILLEVMLRHMEKREMTPYPDAAASTWNHPYIANQFTQHAKQKELSQHNFLSEDLKIVKLRNVTTYTIWTQYTAALFKFY